MDIHALKRQGMTISEIARRTNHDRKTIRAYLAGQRSPGVRQRAAPDPFDAFVDYVTARLKEDPHLWVATLLDEIVPLGFTGSYQTLTRQIRDRSLRPACTACAHVTKRPNAIIEGSLENSELSVRLGRCARIIGSRQGGLEPRNVLPEPVSRSLLPRVSEDARASGLPFSELVVFENDDTDPAASAFIAALESGVRSTVAPGQSEPYRTRSAEFSNVPSNVPSLSENGLQDGSGGPER